MARAHRYEMLPHVHALLALVEQADDPELLFVEIVALLAHEAPVIVEAHVVRSVDHVEGVRLPHAHTLRPRCCVGDTFWERVSCSTRSGLGAARAPSSGTSQRW